MRLRRARTASRWLPETLPLACHVQSGRASERAGAYLRHLSQISFFCSSSAPRPDRKETRSASRPSDF